MNSLQNLIEQLEKNKNFTLNMAIGLDGFVDEIIHMVDKRQDFDSFTRIRTIKAFGERIARAAGLSSNIEMVTTQTKLGGNGPILSNALIEYGTTLTYIGALGVPDIHPVFKPLAERARIVYSLSNPGHTDAAEFEDGKIMLGKHYTLKDITWDAFKLKLGGAEGIAKMINNIDLFGMENWTMIPHMSAIWEGLINEVFPLLKTKNPKPLAFFDLADPEKRTKEDIFHAMKLIGTFENCFRTILGLNEKEVYEIANVFNIKYNNADADMLKKNTLAVAEKLNIYCLVVHPVKNALCVIDGQYYEADGPYCKNPVLTTGAGDNFNAGFCLAQALGFDPYASLLLGVATSGFYVRNANSPTFSEIIRFIKQWDSGNIE